MKKRSRVFIILDQSMIWEAYSDVPIELILQNNDKGWYRKLIVTTDGTKIDAAEDILQTITDEKIALPGLKDEEQKHIIVKPQRK